MQNECFLAYHSYLEICSSLNDAEFGCLIRAALIYSATKEIPKLPGNEKHLFGMFKMNVDRDNKRYEEKCEANKANILKRCENRGSTQSNTAVYDRIPTDTNYTNKNKIKDKIINPLSTNVDIPLFEKFWSAYPKKVAKQAADKAFAKLNLSEATLNVILAGVRKWAETEQWQNDGGRFIPNPSTFLNGGRWKDEVPKGEENDGFNRQNPARKICTEYLE